MKRTPLTTDNVHQGVCIRCDPNNVPHGVLIAYQERKANSSSINTSGSMNHSSNSMTYPEMSMFGNPPLVAESGNGKARGGSVPAPILVQSQPTTSRMGDSSTGSRSLSPRREGGMPIPPPSITPSLKDPPSDIPEAFPSDINAAPSQKISPKPQEIDVSPTPLVLKINDSTAEAFMVTLSNASESTTVLQIKQQIQKEKGIPVAHQELCLAYETLLVNDDTLGHYNLLSSNNDTDGNVQIDVFYPPNYPCTQLLIDQFGETHPAAVRPCDTLEEGILQTIRSSPWFADQLRYMNPDEVERIWLQLSWKGEALTDTKLSLAELEIPNESILHLEVSQKEGVVSNDGIGNNSSEKNYNPGLGLQLPEQAPMPTANQRKPAPVPVPPPAEDPMVLAARLQKQALENTTNNEKKLPPADLDPNDPLALAARLQEKAFEASKIQRARQERVHKKVGLSKVAGGGGTATERLARARNYQDTLPIVTPAPATSLQSSTTPSANTNGDDYEAPIAYESPEVRMARAKAWQQVADSKLEQVEAAERERQARARLENQSKPAASATSGGVDHGDNYEAPIVYESEEVRLARAKAWQQVADAKIEQEEAEERERQALARLQGRKPPSKAKGSSDDEK